MNAQQVWQSQPTDAPRISLEYVRHQARSLESRMRLRNAVEYGTGALTFVLFGFSAWHHAARPIMVGAMVWLALWSLYYVYRWRRDAAAAQTPADSGVLDTLRFQRRQLERQRDVRRRSWRWWAPTVAPGIVLFLVSMLVEQHPVRWGEFAFVTVWMTGGIAIATRVMENGARRLQKEIDALDSLAEPRSER